MAASSGGGGAAGPPAGGAAVLLFTGCAQFRQRLVLATLAGRRIRIDNIRDRDEELGLRDFEATFLRLLDKLTNGSRIEINETGTSLKYSPGFVTGGTVEHDCGTSRALGWFLEGLLPLVPFGKRPVRLSLTGITNDDTDFSVDYIKELHLPLLAHFGLREGLGLDIKRRGCAPGGGGHVLFSCGVVRELLPVNLVEEGFVKRIRGVAYTCKVSPQAANRMLEAARGLLNSFIPDVYIHTDAMKGADGGASPGFGIALVASSTSGCLYGAQRATGNAKGTAAAVAAAAPGARAEPPSLPEDLGREAAALLVDEIARGGAVDTQLQPLLFTLMALGPEDVSRARIGQLGPAGIATLRLLRDMLGIVFKLKPEAQAAPPPEAAAVAGAAAGGADGGEGEEGVAAGAVAGAEKGGKRKRAPALPDPTETPLALEAGGGYSAPTVLVSCLGIGFKNYAKKVT